MKVIDPENFEQEMDQITEQAEKDGATVVFVDLESGEFSSTNYSPEHKTDEQKEKIRQLIEDSLDDFASATVITNSYERDGEKIVMFGDFAMLDKIEDLCEDCRNERECGDCEDCDECECGEEIDDDGEHTLN